MLVEGRGPSSRRVQEVAKERGLTMSLATPGSIQKLQAALHAKAKEEPDFRFYLLYDKVYRKDVLEHAYARCKANKGAAGVDGERFEDVEAYGVERWIGELAETLRKRMYQPQAVKRVYIPKPGGKMRPLGIPTLRDRVVQTATMMVIEPIFEADLQPEQYAYRAGRNALTAVREVHSLLKTGHKQVVDADLSSYFDTIPHAELMKSVARRIVDRHLLHLIKMWLDAPVEEGDGRGNTQRTTVNRDQGRGTPQGAPISPLLSGLYMRRFILGWKQRGYEERFGSRIVCYADDLVICCRWQAEQAMAAMQDMMGRLKLTVNAEKTRICRVPEAYFDFLGYTFGLYHSEKTGYPYVGMRPSKKSVQRMVAAISAETTSQKGLLDAKTVVERLNQMLEGWANYFYLGPVRKAYRTLDEHATRRLRRWLCMKHKVAKSGGTRFPHKYLYQDLGLVRLPERTRNLPWAKV